MNDDTTSVAALQAEIAQLREENTRLGQRLTTAEQHVAFLQGFLDDLPAVVFAKDLEGRYLLVNKCLSTLMHVSVANFMDRTDQELFSSKGEIVAQVHANDQQVVMDGKAIEFEEHIPLDDGLHIYLSLKFPLYDEQGRIVATGGIATDITARKQAEAALQAELAQAISARDEMPAV
jgi:PAS domain S-box-containing protein